MKRILAYLLLLLAAPALGQTLPPGISPELIEQFQRLPVSEQRALARQYGITLPSSLSSADTNQPVQLSTPGQALVPAQELAPNGDQLPLQAPNATTILTDSYSTSLERYGQSLFDQTVSTFAPTDDALVENSYVLGVGDELNIQFFGKQNEAMTLQVARDGAINLPQLGPLMVAGLSLSQARELIDSRVDSELIGVSAVVTMGRLRAINVFMAGEVTVPGAYSMSSLATVTQALFQAGGVSEIGSLRDIQVHRNGRVVGTFDLYDLLMRGDSSGDLRLRSGDVVFVPPYAGLVGVRGEVKRPAFYEVVGGETFHDVLKMAGSFTSDAFPSEVTIRRIKNSLNVARTIDLTDETTLQLEAKDGDELTVPPNPDITLESVSLEGAVQRAGVYGWRSGMRVSDLIRNPRADLNANADLTYSLIVREVNDQRDVTIKSFSILKALAEPRSNHDPELNEFDRLLVFAVPTILGEATLDSREALLAPLLNQLRLQASDDSPVQVYSVSGGVRAPGRYPLTSDTSVSDMIVAAGGLKDSAYLDSAELRTIRVDGDNRVRTSTRALDLTNLDSLTQTRVQSRDNLLVRELDDWAPTSSVQLSGEVLFPGTYLIARGETLSSVIERAGGLTSDAFVEGAQFTRESIARIEELQAREFAENIRRSFASMMLTEESTSASFSEVKEVTDILDSFTGNGRLLIDLWAVIREADVDVALEDGDTLVVPRKTATVTVVGEVNRSSTHSYQVGLSVEDYLELSAGLTSRADKESMYVVRANGQVTSLEHNWWRFQDERRRLRPGDTIVVPVNVEHKESLARWREVTQILYQSIVSVAAVARL